MNAMWSWLTLPLMERFGWALVHFLWQGAAIGGLLAVGLALARRASADLRYGACCAALALMLAAPAVTFTCVGPRSPAVASVGATALTAPPAAAGDTHAAKAEFRGGGRAPGQGADGVSATVGAASAAPAPAARTAPVVPWYRRCADWLDDHLPWLVAGWAAGVVALTIRLLGGWLLLQRIRRSAVGEGCAAGQAALDRLRDCMAVRCGVRVATTALAHTPMVVGWLRPIILLPPCMLTGLSAEELGAVLAHELAHIRRYDYLVNLVQSAAVTLLFYHPAVHWASHRMRVERELCCDEAAVKAVGDRVAYARALARAEDVRRPPALAMGLRHMPLLERVRHVLGVPVARRHTPWAAGLGTVAVVVALTLGLGAFQARLAEAAPLTLHEAAELGDVQTLRARLLEGADVNGLDDDGMTPLQRAAQAGQAYAARLLVKRGAGVEATGSAQGGRTPLHLAASAGQPEVCALLLDAGANIEARDSVQYTPLILASFGDHPETVSLLLERGANVNAANEWTWTSLHCAAQHCCTDVARILLEHGIVPTVKSNQGETAMDRAHDCGAYGIIAMLTPDTAETRAAQQTYGLPGKALVLDGYHALRPLRLRIVHAGSREPLAEADVTFERALGTLHPDRDGMVVVPVPEGRGGTFIVVVASAGMTPKRLQWPSGGVPNDYTVEMAPGMPFGGLVRDAQGRPVRGAQVSVTVLQSLSPTESAWLAAHVEKTDLTGRWQCDLAPQKLATLLVIVSHPDYLGGDVRRYTGDGLERLLAMHDVITLERGYRLRGVVLDDRGRPLPGAFVTMTAEGWRNKNEVETDGSGRFRSLAQAGGSHVLMAHCEGRAPGLKLVEVGPEVGPIEFRLGPGHTIRGRIVGPDGKPLDGAWAVVTSWRGYAPKFYWAPTGPDGRFVWSSAPDEPVGFEFWKDDYVTREGVMLRPSDEEQAITLEPTTQQQVLPLGAAPAKALELRVYDVRDLLTEGDILPADQLLYRAQDLVSLIEQSCGEEGTWGPAPPEAKAPGAAWAEFSGSLRGTIMVQQTPQVHECVAKLLADLRATKSIRVAVDAAAFVLEAGAEPPPGEGFGPWIRVALQRPQGESNVLTVLSPELAVTRWGQGAGSPREALARAAKWHLDVARLTLAQGETRPLSGLQGVSLRAEAIAAPARLCLLDVRFGIASLDKGATRVAETGTTAFIVIGDAARELAKRWLKPEELAGLDLSRSVVVLTLNPQIQIISEMEVPGQPPGATSAADGRQHLASADVLGGAEVHDPASIRSAKTLATAVPRGVAYLMEEPSAAMLAGPRRVPVERAEQEAAYALEWITRAMDAKWLPTEKGVLKDSLVLLAGDGQAPDQVRASWRHGQYKVEVSQTEWLLLITVTPDKGVDMGATVEERVAFAKGICGQILADQDYRRSINMQRVPVHGIVERVTTNSFSADNTRVFPDGIIGARLTAEQAGVPMPDQKIREEEYKPDNPNWADQWGSWRYWWRQVCWWHNGTAMGFYFPKAEEGPFGSEQLEFKPGPVRWLESTSGAAPQPSVAMLWPAPSWEPVPLPGSWGRDRLWAALSKYLESEARRILPGSKVELTADTIKVLYKTREYEVDRPSNKGGAPLVRRTEVGPQPDGLVITVQLTDTIGQTERPQEMEEPYGRTHLGQVSVPELGAYLQVNVTYGPDTDRQTMGQLCSPTTWLRAVTAAKPSARESAAPVAGESERKIIAESALDAPPLSPEEKTRIPALPDNELANLVRTGNRSQRDAAVRALLARDKGEELLALAKEGPRGATDIIIELFDPSATAESDARAKALVDSYVGWLEDQLKADSPVASPYQAVRSLARVVFWWPGEAGASATGELAPEPHYQYERVVGDLIALLRDKRDEVNGPAAQWLGAIGGYREKQSAEVLAALGSYRADLAARPLSKDGSAAERRDMALGWVDLAIVRVKRERDIRAGKPPMLVHATGQQEAGKSLGPAESGPPLALPASVGATPQRVDGRPAPAGVPSQSSAEWPRDAVPGASEPSATGARTSTGPVVSEPSPAVAAERDRRLARADKELRDRLTAWSKQFPNLAKSERWAELGRPSPAGSIRLNLMYPQPKGKAAEGDSAVPEAERYGVLVVITPPPQEPEQLRLGPMYPHLGLVGQVSTAAGNPELAGTLRGLVRDALAPLASLDAGDSGILSRYLLEPQPDAALAAAAQGVVDAAQSISVEYRSDHLYSDPALKSEWEGLEKSLRPISVDVVRISQGRRDGEKYLAILVTFSKIGWPHSAPPEQWLQWLRLPVSKGYRPESVRIIYTPDRPTMEASIRAADSVVNDVLGQLKSMAGKWPQLRSVGDAEVTSSGWEADGRPRFPGFRYSFGVGEQTPTKRVTTDANWCEMSLQFWLDSGEVAEGDYAARGYPRLGLLAIWDTSSADQALRDEANELIQRALAPLDELEAALEARAAAGGRVAPTAGPAAGTSK